MRIAVCDDNEQDISRMGRLIAEYQLSRNAQIDCHYFINSTEFLSNLKSGTYDLVLLDVLMPGVDGIQAARELRELDENVRLVFASASPEFAVESYHVGAYYYLLKPIDADLFFSMLDKIRGELSAQAEQGFILKSRDGVVWVAFAKLAYVEVINKTLFFHLADGVVREITAPLGDYEGKLLSRSEFLKTHRSYLVNLNYVQALENNSLQMKSGHSLPISRQRHGRVRDAYMYFLQQAGTEDSVSAAHEQEHPDGPWRILLVDDDKAALGAWADILKGHGCIVDLADNGEEALRLAEDSRYDCVLLDVMIPGDDGFSICERLHKFTDTPVIFLSCLTEPDKQLKGFASGGIDYITKDTSAELFWAKVETRIRLSVSERAQLCYGPLLLDLAKRRALIEDKELSLTPIEFDLLCRLSERPGQIFTPEELYGAIWGSQPWDGGQMVQTHMSKLRRTMEKAWAGHCFIETVWGQGYRFAHPKQ